MNVLEDEVIVIEHPPEEVVKTSPLVVIAGFAVLAGVTLLAIFAWASQGERNGQPDVFGKRVTVREVAERYKAAWSPGVFWPRDAFMHTKKTDQGSPLFKIIWTFLTAWFICLAFYLIFAGAISAIEVFREERHLRAGMCISAAFCLCAVWPVLFRVGSHVPPQQVKTGAQQVQAYKRRATDGAFVAPTVDKSKGVWLWISCVVLALAWALAFAAAAQLQAWTLPGPQFGTLIFLAPGYGLFAGWLLYATFLNLGVAMSFDSYPEGTRAMPMGGNAEYIHRGSIWPVVASLIALGGAVAVPDPGQPLPMAVALAFFTPRYRTNVCAVLICLGGVAFATWRMLTLRDWEF